MRRLTLALVATLLLCFPARLFAVLGTPVAVTGGEGFSDANVTTGNSYTTGSHTISANRLIVLALLLTGTSLDPTAVTGHGLTWTKLLCVDYNNVGSPTDNICVYYAMTVGSGSTDTISVQVAGNTTAAMWRVTEQSGHDTTTPIVQSAQDAEDLGTAVNPTLAAFGDAANATYLIVGHTSSGTTITPEGGYSQIGSEQASTAPTAHLFPLLYLGSNDTTPTATLGAGRDFAAVAFEVAAAAGGGGGETPRRTLLMGVGK